ncbi:olfactory receptor 5AS1-like [Ambystoma mexicanum]|uniref:olfactory receptor 5AS1-like n=1 Tax=Ambystoma mexicanum TaxID=8296 RepID=UPI0037E7ABEF
MEYKNQTIEIYFLLNVFSDVTWLRIVLPLLFLIIYLLTLLGNVLLIILRKMDPRLHTPMYFFLGHLSFIDIFFTTTIAPKMLANFFSGDNSITILGCATQMFFALALGSAECLLIAVMAYDRHVAICQPLRYHILMSKRICFVLAATCWFSGLVNSLLHTVFTFRRPFCKSREIKHFFCEIQPLLRLSCADTHIHEMCLFATSVTIVLCTFLMIFISYVHIISTILKIKSSNGKSKVFSTCSSHLLVVIIFYGTIMSIYLRPISSYISDTDRAISLLYTMVIPMCNPLIYSVRNKEVKGALRKAMGNNVTLFKCGRHLK